MRRLVQPTAVSLDRERSLLFDTNAIVAFEEATGKSPISAIAPLAAIDKDVPDDRKMAAVAKMRFADLRALLWAGLLHEDESLTQKQVGAWLTMGGMLELAPKLVAAVLGVYPEAKDRVDPPNPSTENQNS